MTLFKPYYLLFIVLVLPLLSFSQKDLEKSIDSISTKEDAKAYLKSNKTEVKGKLVTFNKEKHKTKLASELFEKSIGGKKVLKTEKGTIIYKIIEKKQTQHYRASIILFKSNEKPISEINSLRSFILKGIRSGEHKFENLARVYSAHPTGKRGGDLGWIKKGTFSKRFEKAIADKKENQVFSFDEHREKKHYVILKTSGNTAIEEITVLKIEDK